MAKKNKNRNKNNKKNKQQNNSSKLIKEVVQTIDNTQSLNNDNLKEIIVAALIEYDKTKNKGLNKTRFFNEFIFIIMAVGALAFIGLGAMIIYNFIQTINKLGVSWSLLLSFIIHAAASIAYVYYGIALFKEIKYMKTESDNQYIMAIGSMIIALAALIISIFKK